MSARLRFGVLGLLVVAASNRVQAQCTPQWVQHFPGADVNASIRCFLSVDEGAGSPTLYAGGSFFQAGGTNVSYVAAWDGFAWAPLGSGMNNGVSALARFDDDGAGPNPPAVYAGGGFTTAGGVPANRVARWDGSSWSALGAGIGGSAFAGVQALAVFDDDGPGPHAAALYASGNFAVADGAPGDRIAKWDGSSWTAVGSGFDAGGVHALAVFDDDGPGPGLPALYAGCSFETSNGMSLNHVARWDGVSWSDVGGGVDGPAPHVYALLAFDADGPGPGSEALYAGGQFTTAGGGAAAAIARWDGASWSGLGSGISGYVESLCGLDPDGAGPDLPLLIAGGTFSFAGGSAANSTAQWDGASWAQMGPFGTGSTVQALAVFDGELHAGGQNFRRWDGTTWRALGRGTESEVYAFAVFDDDASGPHAPALYAGGKFTRAGGGAANLVARWDGSSWSPLGSGVDHPTVTGDAVVALTAFDDDGPGPGSPALYAGGYFTMAGGASANYVARWNGSAWSPLGSGTSDIVSTFAAYDEDGSGPNPPVLFVGGSFTTAGGIVVNGIARWNGSTWSAVGGGTNGSVGALAVYDGDGPGSNPQVLVAAGSFTTAGGVAANRIAMWNGTVWFPLGTGMNNGVSDLAVLDEDNAGPNAPILYAGGYFTTAGGAPAAGIAKWTGGAWSGVAGGLGGFTPSSSALCVFDDDGAGPGTPDLYVGGPFTSVGGGVPASRIARWSGSSWTTLSTGANADVFALTVFDEDGPGPQPSALYAGGSFTSTGGISAERVARWVGCGSSIASFCFGDGTGAPCPCGNSGASGRGCQNSHGTGGALLTAAGSTALAADTLVLSVSGELPSALTIVLQGNALIAPTVFGDGLRCAGGALKRLYVRNASGGGLVAPSGSEATVSLRSAALGDPIAGGGVRQYQTYYRDPSAVFCPAPAGNTWNASSGISVVWNP